MKFMKVLNQWIYRRDLWVTTFLLTAVPGSFANALVDIAGEPRMSAEATGVSGDGKIIVGMKTPDDPFSRVVGFQYVNGHLETLEALSLRSSVFPHAVTPDGTIIVGTNYDFMMGSVPVKWVNGKISELPLLPGGIEASAEAISADGRVIVGNGNINLGASSAVKWEDGVATQLKALPSSMNAYAHGVSGDGSIIVGTMVDVEWRNTAVKWTTDQVIAIGNLGGATSSAKAISTDGTVIVGGAENKDFHTHAYAYKNGTMSDLGTLGGFYSLANAVSSDGSVIVGVATNSDHKKHAFQYADGKIVDLGTLGGDESYAQGVSGDGKVIIGKAQIPSGDWHAFLCPFQAPSPGPVQGGSTIVTSQRSRGMVDINTTYSSLKNSQVTLQRLLTQYGAKIYGGSSGVPSFASVRNRSWEQVSSLQNDVQKGTVLSYSSQIYGNLQQNQLLTGAFMDWKLASDPKASFKVAFSYGSQDVIVGRAALAYTEQGLGKSVFSGFGGQVQGRYDLPLGGTIVMQPFMGLQVLHVSREGYSEHNVLFPVSYNSVAYSAATGFVGAHVFASLTPEIKAVATLGLEQDLSSHVDDFTGLVSTLGHFVIENSAPISLRSFTSLTMYYDLPQQQSVTLSVAMNQQ
ncbi:autotransporter domain-containing protein, partial [Candidatus Chlamydia corallus]|uniref:autotransporter domain-containing protein n=1 Tax=Candidatus Chlamydia corallus TaxID=2038470 RepID=UPI001EFEDA9B